MDEERAASALAALGNRTRLRVFRLLVRAGEGGLNVGEVQARLDVPASTLAHHLGSLTRAGLVRQDRQGREVICRADYAAMRGLLGYLSDECCLGVAEEDGTEAA